MEQVIEVHVGCAWAMEKCGFLYYANGAFFGIQQYEINPPELGGGPHKFIQQIMNGEEPPEDNWLEIAQQLFAMKEGWA